MLANYAKLEYMLYAYYMRGYRRGLDVREEYGEAMARFHNDDTVEFPLRMLSLDFANIRHFGPSLGNLTELYRITFDKRYLEIAGDYAEALIQMFPGPDYGTHRGAFWDRITEKPKTGPLDPETFQRYMYKLYFCWVRMANYARLIGDSQFTEAMNRYAIGSAR